MAGHKGKAGEVRKKKRKPRRRRLKGKRGRGTMETEKPPVFGLFQRKGPAVMRVLPNVQKKTIKPIIEKVVSVGGTLVYTDEYSIYSNLSDWGYEHKAVNHSRKEYARDEDGDGFHEVHVNTGEGVWSLLRSWLRPHRGVSQENLPLYVGFFQSVYNSSRRGIRLLPNLLSLLSNPSPQKPT